MSLYIDEAAGLDDVSVNGTQEKPFKTPAYALFSARDASEEPKLLVFKKDPENGDGFVEISASALKKARKGCDGLKKKLAKQAEQEKKKQEQEEKEAAKKLESLNISIKQDESLPDATKYKIIKSYDAIDQRVKVSGWIHRQRSSKS